MPGFATSEGTKSNAWTLMHALGVTGAEIDIRPAARQMLADIGHPFAEGEPVYDVTFENVQAGLRTDYLFRLANQRSGFVIGTGDLSELALGWCTYGVGDQMSHYDVNAGVPKTLIQYLIRWAEPDRPVRPGDRRGARGHPRHRDLARAGARRRRRRDPDDRGEDRPLRAATTSSCTTSSATASRRRRSPSSPGTPGATRETGLWPIDFPRGGAAAVRPRDDPPWLEKFLWRFFAFSQFKRSALPNGPKVSAGGALSPRGDWRAPSDAAATVWLDELRANVPEV